MATAMLAIAFVFAAGLLIAHTWSTYRAFREAARWNNATTPEEIQALLPPGDRYDPETGLCYPPEPGALPYRRGQKVVRV